MTTQATLLAATFNGQAACCGAANAASVIRVRVCARAHYYIYYNLWNIKWNKL